MEEVLSNKIGREELQPGDHIYSWRSGGVYAHHGIHIGDEKVIHFTSTAGQATGIGTSLSRFIFSSSAPSHTGIYCKHCSNVQQQYQAKPVEKALAGSVIISCLDCFLSGGNLYHFAYSVSKDFFMAQDRGGTCTMAPSDPPDLVIYRAIYLLNHGFGSYSLFKKNCEDFTIYCKTSLVKTANGSLSGQVTSAVTTTISFAVSLLGGLGGLVGEDRKRRELHYVNDLGVRTDVAKVPVERILPTAAASSVCHCQKDSSMQCQRVLVALILCLVLLASYLTANKLSN